MKKIVITGTGRAGTTFLVELFTLLGFDTGFSTHSIRKLLANTHESDVARAGLEVGLNKHDPYIIKSPDFCESIGALLEEGLVKHIIVPVRGLFAAAESRRLVQQRAKTDTPVDGGYISSTDHPNEDQEIILLKRIYNLLMQLSVYDDVPITFILFPKLVQDPKYLFRKLRPVLAGHDYESFLASFYEVAKPELVHEFKKPGGGNI